MLRQTVALVMATVALATPMLVSAQQKYDDTEHAELGKAMKEAKVPLQTGLAASAEADTPVSAKYEVEHGKLQLSVYTMKGGNFAESIIDHKTGKVAKVDPITGGDDLAAAKAQADAMAKAKRSLAAAVADAQKANTGYRAVSIIPALNDSHPVAEVVLVKGTEWKAVSEKLD
jgi:hypothetical protein